LLINFKNGKQKFEITGDIDVYKYFITVDYGLSQNQISETEFNYRNAGSYSRIGIDYDFLFFDEDNHVIFFGLRYARSFFSEKFDYSIYDSVYGPYDLYVENQDARARWWEMNAGLKARIWKQLYVGWTGRFKFAQKSSGDDNLSVYQIPGFGLAENKSRWGFNYYIYYRFPFRNKPRILQKEEIIPIEGEDDGN